MDIQLALKAMRRRLEDFDEAWQSTVIVVATSLTLVLLQRVNAAGVENLASDIDTPWGVVSGVFLHSGWNHFLANSTVLGGVLFFLLLANGSLPAGLRRRRSRHFAILSCAQGVIANVAWLALMPASHTRGASGIAYAAVGVLLGFSLCNLFPPSTWRANLWAFYGNPAHTRHLLFNLGVFAVFFLNIQLQPATFLGVGPGVNVFGHFIGFFPAFVVAMVVGFRDRGSPTPSSAPGTSEGPAATP